MGCTSARMVLQKVDWRRNADTLNYITRYHTNVHSECKESKACAPSKHHFDECVERVTGAGEGEHDKKHPSEDCVEECESSSPTHCDHT